MILDERSETVEGRMIKMKTGEAKIEEVIMQIIGQERRQLIGYLMQMEWQGTGYRDVVGVKEEGKMKEVV